MHFAAKNKQAFDVVVSKVDFHLRWNHIKESGGFQWVSLAFRSPISGDPTIRVVSMNRYAMAHEFHIYSLPSREL
jgi:hypothetical protein